jgi:hypothetical protein
MCSAVRNAKESDNELPTGQSTGPIVHIPDSAAHARGTRNLADTCNILVWQYLRSIETCTSVHNWHQSFDLVELVVALFFIFNSAAHFCGLSYFYQLCSGLGRQYIQIIGVCTSVLD